MSLVDFLLQHNAKQTELFTSPDASLWRRQYRSKHPTEIAALKCMDGRLNLAIMTNTPPGIIQPYRNVGGLFDLGWPFFGQLIEDWVNYSVRVGRDCLLLITYHWSKGETHRGCRGFQYDMGAAREYTKEIQQQAERVFGSKHTIVYPVRVGIETDEDALVLHGQGDQTIELASLTTINEADLRKKIEWLFPDMKQQMVTDLLPLLLGNLEHIAKVRNSQRPITDAEHREQILGIGRGFDWLHLPNKALIIGPFSYDLAQPIATAANILWSNLEEGRIPKDEGIVLLSSSVYREEAGPESARAMEKSASLARFALTTIKANVPQLEPYLKVLTGTVNLNTRKFTPLPFDL